MVQDLVDWQVGVQVVVGLAHDAPLANLLGQRAQLLLQRQGVAVVEPAGGLDQDRRPVAGLDPGQSGVDVRGGGGEHGRGDEHPPAITQLGERFGQAGWHRVTAVRRGRA